MPEDAASLELQQELQRFTTQLTDRIAQAAEALEHARRPEVRTEALRATLRYVSAAMEIATGPVAEVNLLDMLVFLRVCRSTLDRHWIPNLYGERGHALLRVFASLEEELDVVGDKVFSPEQRLRLDGVVDAWLAAHPEQVRVEGIRLSDFAEAAASGAQVQGMMARITNVTRTASQALLLSERAIFLVHRLPFLWRLQAKLGAHEIVSDLLLTLVGEDHLPLARWGQRAKSLAWRAGAAVGALALGGTALRMASRARR